MKLGVLQAGRAVAAIMVVIFHAHSFFIHDRLYQGAVVLPALNVGYAGVEFFFVLSGFIMALIHRKDASQPARLFNFLRKRLVRIYPFYWIVLAAVTTAYFMVPNASPGAGLGAIAIIRSFLLIPSSEHFIIHGAWTLSHEMLFYLIFCIFIINARIGVTVFGVWTLCIFAFGIIGRDNAFTSFVFSHYNLLFIFGILSSILLPRISELPTRLMAFLAVCCFTGAGLLDVYGVWGGGRLLLTLIYGISGAIMIASLASAESAGKIGVSRILVFLGDASYAIYIVHGPTLAAVSLVLRKTGLAASIPPSVTLALIVSIAVVVGSIAHVVLEKPLLKFLRPRKSPPLAQSVRQPPAQSAE